jgi:hypothetical protein
MILATTHRAGHCPIDVLSTSQDVREKGLAACVNERDTLKPPQRNEIKNEIKLMMQVTTVICIGMQKAGTCFHIM